MKTAVVILNWNGKKLLESFLPGIMQHTTLNAKVIIADNASTDDSVDYIKNNFAGADVIKLATNEGFARGYNSALKKIDAQYYLLLNSDVEVTENWLEPLVNYLDTHPMTAVCQPRIRSQKEKEKFEYAGAAGGYIDALGYPFCRGRIFGYLENDNNQYNDIVPVFWSSGACMLIRAEVFKKAGGFDELFFAHMEEIDLCWRIRNMGYEIVCVPDSVVYHVGGATLPKNNPGKTYLNFRNNLSMLYKNLPSGKLFLVILIRLVLDMFAAFKFLVESGIGDFNAVIRAHFSFYSFILSGKLKRNRTGIINHHPTIYKGNIVWDHYISKKNKFTSLDFHPGQPVKK